MPPRSRGNAEKTEGASPPAPKHAPPPIFLPLPPHPVDRWSREDARAEPVEQLLYGPVHTRRPTLVRAPLGSEAEAALGAEAGSQLFGDGTDMAAAYKAVAYGLRDGWESCPPQVSSRLAVDLPRWLAPRVAGDLLCRVPALAATQHGQARRPGSGRAAGHLRLEAPSRSARQPGTPEESYCRLGPAVQPRSGALEPLRGAAQHADFAAFDDHPGRADARGRRLLPRALRSRQGGGRRERGGPLLLPAGRRRRRAEHRVAARQPRAQAGSGAALERRRQRQRRRGRRRRRLRAQQLRGRQRVCGQRGGDVAVGGGAPRGLALPCARRSATPRRDDACTSGLVAAAAHLRNEC